MIKSNVIILFWTHFFQGRQSTVKYLEVNEIKPKNTGFRVPISACWWRGSVAQSAKLKPE